MGGHEDQNPSGNRWLMCFSRRAWRQRIVTFTPSWYVLTMGTGVVVQVLHNFPYRAYWLHNLAFCFWILDIILFVFFTTLGFARATLERTLSKALILDFAQTSYLGAVPIALDTVLEGLVIFFPDNAAAVWVAFALYWIAMIICFVVGVGGLLVVSTHQLPQRLDSINAVWLLSFIPFIVNGGIGGSLAPLLRSNAAATLCLTTSFMSWSIGILMTHLILAVYMYRLTACSLPPAEAIVTCFIPMGPTGMGAFGIQMLSQATTSILQRTGFAFQSTSSIEQDGNLHKSDTRTVAECLHWLGAIIGLFLVAEATSWLAFTVGALTWRTPRRFNASMWAVVFPCGVYANALCLLGSSFRNGAWRGYAATMCSATVLLWCACATMTIYNWAWRGDLFIAPGLEGWHEKVALQQLKGRGMCDDKRNGGENIERGRDVESGQSSSP